MTDFVADVGSDGPIFNLFDPQWSSDPFPLYAELRARAPIHRNELGFWVAARHGDCLAVLRERGASVERSNMLDDEDSARFDGRVIPSDEETAKEFENRSFLVRDPPDHTRLRGLVAKAFTPKVVEGLRGRTQEIVDELIDTALSEGAIDLVDQFAYPLPVRVICDLLGVPVADQDRFKGWSHALARGLDPNFLLPQEVLDASAKAREEFAAYFFELVGERRRSPGDDLLSQLVAAEDSGTVLSEAELLSTCILLLVAGHETTVNLIAGGALALLEHPSQLARFRDDPAVARSGVEEMLRFVSPVQLTGRTLLQGINLGDVRIEAGQFVMLLLASGNRDSLAFDNPDDFNVARTPNNHLGFGFGVHHCLGAPLARMEADVALSTLFRRVPHLALASDVVTYKANVILRGMESMPVSL
ncbi:MAG TPA: cytochrome P450 [Acidimicrobiales bacterium]|nr:cytochrome P450 [Acidimicrobiales bacterium]